MTIDQPPRASAAKLPSDPITITSITTTTISMASPPTTAARFGVSPTHDGVYYPEDDEPAVGAGSDTSGASFPVSFKARLDSVATKPAVVPAAITSTSPVSPTTGHQCGPLHACADAQPGLHKRGHPEPVRDGGAGGDGDEHSHLHALPHAHGGNGHGHDGVNYQGGERCNFATNA